MGEIGLAKMTGVVHDWKQTDTEQREMVKDQVSAMEKDLERHIIKAVGIGEARMKKVEDRGQIADNYLALKAYAGSMAGDIIDAVTKGQGKALFSVGDFLTTVAALSAEHTKPAEGVTAGL